ncbi:hypothetical protein [Pseudochrobactrum saccharolyticum]|uniref:hypothetical protein n=1 Tax=Pseudochrobactrum saccharolyticum TaxID=354352 RepID=UPI002742B8FA|nr:hypothetical protein [Pseudochrobactrum saccharolyticum]MDP8250392.1 hypothetical protein [Pseudochrobactrum saccharolyticum]
MNNLAINFDKSTPERAVSQQKKPHYTPLGAAQGITTKLSMPNINDENRSLGAILKNTGGGLSRFR